MKDRMLEAAKEREARKANAMADPCALCVSQPGRVVPPTVHGNVATAAAAVVVPNRISANVCSSSISSSAEVSRAMRVCENSGDRMIRTQNTTTCNGHKVRCLD